MLKTFITLLVMALFGQPASAELSADKTEINGNSGKAVVSVSFPAPVTGDLYLAFNLNDQLYFYSDTGTISTKVTAFRRNTKFSQTMQVLTVSAENVKPGVYSLYQVVTLPDTDPLNFSNWIGGLTGLSLLNFKINLSDTPTVPSSITTTIEDSTKLTTTSNCLTVKLLAKTIAKSSNNPLANLKGNEDSHGVDDSAANDSQNCTSPTTTPSTVNTTPTITPVITTNTSGTPNLIQKGQTVYQKICSGCHGSNPGANQNNILKGRDVTKIRAAIKNDKGGVMGVLSNMSDPDDLQAVAEYLKSLP